MAGTIELESGHRWIAASWLFDWVVRVIAETVDDVDISAELGEIVNENLGWLSLRELSGVHREKVRRVIAEILPEMSRAELPAGLPQREEVIRHVEALQEESPPTAIVD